MLNTNWIQTPRSYWQSALVKLTHLSIFTGHCTVRPEKLLASQRRAAPSTCSPQEPHTCPSAFSFKLLTSHIPTLDPMHDTLHTSGCWRTTPRPWAGAPLCLLSPCGAQQRARAHPTARWLPETLLLLLLCFSCGLGGL